MCHVYRVSQEERSVFWEVTLVILIKKVYIVGYLLKARTVEAEKQPLLAR
jgi:hypothetical protein